MGRSKATVEVAGVPMATRVADAMRSAGAATVVLGGGSPAEGAELGLEVVADRWPGEGPLAGMATAVRWAAEEDAEIVLLAACDQPNLSTALFTHLAEALSDSAYPSVTGSVVVTPDGRIHPFPAAWRTSSAPSLEQLVEDGQRRADAALVLGIATVDAGFGAVIDVDRPDDLPAAERAVASVEPTVGPDHSTGTGR